MFELQRVLVSAALAATALGIGLTAGPARAGCNDIPEKTNPTWRGYRGTVDTVFGHRGIPSPIRDVEVGSNTCFPTTLVDNNYVVTVIFKPPRGGPRNIVALTTAADCSALSCDDKQKSYHCVPGANANLLVSKATNTVRFRFPDRDGIVPPPAKGPNFTGPALIAVTPSADPLPCKLANQRCRDSGGPANLFACVDELFDVGSCGTARSDLDPPFAHFTALPAMNDWQKMCEESASSDPVPKCKNKAIDILFTVDEAGNVLLPVSWAQILEAGSDGKKKNREVEGRTNITRTKGGTKQIRIPSKDFLASFMPNGGGWPSKPKFEPDSQGAWLVLRGESDVDESVLRISRRELWEYECKGGNKGGQACHPNASGDCPGTGAACVKRAQPSYFACESGSKAGSYCTRSSDCPGGQCTPGSACVKTSGQPAAPPPPPKSNPPCLTDLACNPDEECGLGLFEFRDQLEGGVGPVVIPKAKYKAKATKYKQK